jgi:adenosyl cobinamide kinase/adenosyl cobinamide phosphate guanylyltransferase
MTIRSARLTGIEREAAWIQPGRAEPRGRVSRSILFDARHLLPSMNYRAVPQCWLIASICCSRSTHDAETDRLCAAVSGARWHVILVANEVGLGIVPDNALARRFRDIAGRMNQAVASIASEVVLIAAGLPLRLK